MDHMLDLQQAAHCIVKSMSPETLRAMVTLARAGRLEPILDAAIGRIQVSHLTAKHLTTLVRQEIVKELRGLAGSFNQTGYATHTTVVSGVRDVQRVTARRAVARV